MALIEINFDGIVGPSHNYAGLSLGNLASTRNAGQVSRPRTAALEGLTKMRANLALGLSQGVLLPHPRPNHAWLGELGTTMGVAQTFAGLARVMAPILATIAFQRLGHGWPFYAAGILVGLVGIMAFQVDVQPRVAKRAAEGAEA